ncbi:MAG: hypothetical protein AB7T07_07245 [Steroidobacteraceae bacterium]
MTIAKNIPAFPNNRQTRDAIKNESLSKLLIHYTNWAVRYVARRPRDISIEVETLIDSRIQKFAPEINQFLEEVRKGEDLTPHLSLEPHTRGYTPNAAIKGIDTNKWADKDFMLIVMGYHHFHLGTKIESGGFTTRTDNLLFAHVSRDTFTVVGVFDHSVFDISRTPDGRMTAERERLWEAFESHATKDIPPGSIYVPAMIATSGHSLHLLRLSAEYAHIIYEIDSKIDDSNYIKDMYERAGITLPKKPKIEWHLNVLDLGLLDQNLNFFVLRQGPN